MELASIYSRENRTRFLIAAAILIVLIATIDWLTKPYISIGFLISLPHHANCRIPSTLADRCWSRSFVPFSRNCSANSLQVKQSQGC